MHILRERMQTVLSTNRVGVLTLSASEGAWAMPVRYRVNNLDLDCLVPRWADIAYYVEPHPSVLMVVLIVLPSPDNPLCWLEYKGNARRVDSPDWSGLLPEGVPETLARDVYLVLHIVPERIDLIDEGQGWGARETLDV